MAAALRTHGPSLALILGVSATLRLLRLDLIDFRYDEAVAAYFAREIVHGAWLLHFPHSGSSLQHGACMHDQRE
jgi:hypothetical protein